MIDPDLTMTFTVTPDSLDGGFISRSTDFPGLIACGRTRREALEAIAEATAGFEAVQHRVEPVVLPCPWHWRVVFADGHEFCCLDQGDAERQICAYESRGAVVMPPADAEHSTVEDAQ